jgi:hypothetical protein
MDVFAGVPGRPSLFAWIRDRLQIPSHAKLTLRPHAQSYLAKVVIAPPLNTQVVITGYPTVLTLLHTQPFLTA